MKINWMRSLKNPAFACAFSVVLFALSACAPSAMSGSLAQPSGSADAGKTFDSFQHTESMPWDASSQNQTGQNSAAPSGSASPLQKIEFYMYDEYTSRLMSETVPSPDELKTYLKRAIAFHNGTVNGEPELWALDLQGRGESLENTQLLAYPVILDDTRTNVYFGVDRNNGNVYRWEENAQDAFPELTTSPERFPTPLSALEYIKNRFWNPSGFTVPFELELILPDAKDGAQSPYYRSQTAPFQSGLQTSTYYITIDHEEPSGYLVHSYEYVTDSPEDGHTATTSWHYVYKNGFISNTIMNDLWIAEEA